MLYCKLHDLADHLARLDKQTEKTPILLDLATVAMSTRWLKKGLFNVQ